MGNRRILTALSCSSLQTQAVTSPELPFLLKAVLSSEAGKAAACPRASVLGAKQTLGRSGQRAHVLLQASGTGRHRNGSKEITGAKRAFAASRLLCGERTRHAAGAGGGQIARCSARLMGQRLLQGSEPLEF